MSQHYVYCAGTSKILYAQCSIIELGIVKSMQPEISGKL